MPTAAKQNQAAIAALQVYYMGQECSGFGRVMTGLFKQAGLKRRHRNLTA